MCNQRIKMFRVYLMLIAIRLLVVIGNSTVQQEAVDNKSEISSEISNDEANDTDTSGGSSPEAEGRAKARPNPMMESDSNDNNDIYESVKHVIKKPAAAVIKCSRRFNPGACLEPVYSVWTYVFDKQNCTERLGCRKSDYSNRFKSYNHCLHRCEPLREIYIEILSMEDGHSKLPHVLRRWRDKFRRQDKNAPLPTTEQPDFENDNSMRPLAREEVDYGLERAVQSEGEWTEDSDEELKVPFDVDSYSADSAVLEHFYYDRD